MRNIFFRLLIGILLLGCSEENPSDVFANSANGDSSTSVNELSSSDISNSSSSENFANFSSSFGAISNSTEISSSSWPQYSYGELIDERDGQVYKTIKIGEQTWMAQNLNYAYLQPTSTKDSSSECNNNESDNCAKFGRLYLWSAAMDSAAIISLDGKGCGAGNNSCKVQPSKGVRGTCPQNWHIPNETDIKNFFDHFSNSIWIEHYWLLTENENSEFKTEMKLRYNNFWTSEQLDNNNNAKGLYFISNTLTTTPTSKGTTFPVRCVKDDEKFHVEHGEMTDERDGQVYKTVKIGNQWWMAENLNYAYIKPMETNFVRNGSTSFCYNNEPDSCKKYGRLYMWDATMDCVDKDIDEEFECNEYHDDNFNTHGICPENWHIPSVNEWKTLQNIVNNFATDLKSTSSWLDDGNGSDILGFGILPAGYYMNYEGREVEFAKIGQQACFWTPRQTTNILDCPYCYHDYAFPICFSSTNKNFLFFKQELKIYAFSVRCIKDSTEAE